MELRHEPQYYMLSPYNIFMHFRHGEAAAEVMVEVEGGCSWGVGGGRRV